jgi:hypothetical protein
MIVEPFNRPICPTFQPGNILDKFLQFFTDELIEEIVVETIRYGNECLKDKNVSWETNLGEIKAFFGMTIIMGFVCLPKLYDYWSTNIQLHAFSIANKISRKLFCEIKRYLHFVNNDCLPLRRQPGYDKVGKIRPVITADNDKFLNSYQPNREQPIDEAMIRFKEGSLLKQYLPKKPIKRGIKVWVRAHSRLGYISQFEVCCGMDG